MENITQSFEELTAKLEQRRAETNKKLDRNFFWLKIYAATIFVFSCLVGYSLYHDLNKTDYFLSVSIKGNEPIKKGDVFVVEEVSDSLYLNYKK